MQTENFCIFGFISAFFSVLKGQCGVKSKQDLCQFEEVPFGNKVVEVAAGWDFSLVLDDHGQVYGCGANSFGQLGLGDSVKDVSELTRIKAIQEKVVKIAAGMRHSLFLTSEGRLIACGSGKKGQLCNDIKDNHFLPIYVKNLDMAENIYAGQNFSVVEMKDGRLQAFGDNKHGQVTSVNNFKDQVCQLEVGWTHVLLRRETGRVQGFGRNDYGQITIKNDAVRKFRQISSGYEHGLGINEDDQLFSWGWNEHGNCGLGHTENVLEPAIVNLGNDYQVIKCFAGSGHSFALAEKA